MPKNAPPWADPCERPLRSSARARARAQRKSAVGVLVLVSLIVLGFSPETVEAARKSAAQCPDRVDINSADLATLRCLPGIGEKRAQAILDYRERHGVFTGPAAFAAVVGVKRAAKLRPQIRVSPP